MTDNIEIEQRLAPAMQAFKDVHTTEAIDLARLALTKMRRDAGNDWGAVIKLVRQSELFQLSQRCPFTKHSFDRPRGYPGDALLLDWIYRDFRLNAAPETNSLSAALYRNTSSSPPATAVRWRKQHLASLIDDIAMEKPQAKVLALACGHLREADVSVALKNGLVKELVALDQDVESLGEVKRQYTDKNLAVTPVHANIRDVIAGRYKLEDFDLVYSAGLYDYLNYMVAKKLSATLFKSLRPGGRLILTNFLHDTPDIGWMNAMMDWFLIFRSQAEIAAFADDIPQEKIARSYYYECPTRSIGYLSIRKKPN